MKYGKKTVVSLLCAAMLLTPLLSACHKNGDDISEAPTTEISTTDTQEALSDFLYSDRTMRYRIVYDAEGTADVRNAANALSTRLSNYVDDKRFCGDDQAFAKGELPEILIGDTNRSESQSLMSDLDENTYKIRKVNGQIVICAAKQWMITDAVEAFMKQIEYSKDRKTATLPETLDITYTYDGTARPRWSIDFPVYEDGVLAEKSFVSNYGIDTISGPKPSNYKMLCASDTNSAELDRYVAKLKTAGYNVKEVENSSSIRSYWVTKETARMYLYHSINAGELRFVVDQNESVSAEDASYTYEKKAGETTEFYAYGLVMSEHGKNTGETYTDANGNKQVSMTQNCGQLLIFKLADNTIFLIDGGSYVQMPESAAVELDRFLHDITNTPADGKVTISNWLITHPHGDHYGGTARFLYNYHELYNVERVTFNFNFLDPDMPAFFNEHFNVRYPDVTYCRPHTGETLQVGDVKVEILYTVEDSVNAQTGALTPDDCPTSWGGNPAVDQNNSSITARITFDGKTFLLTGDINWVAQDVLLKNYSTEELHCDILQVSHHGLNYLDALYSVVKPSVSVYSQNRAAAPLINSGTARRVLESVIKHTVGGEDNIYFHGNYTAKLTVNENGEIVGEKFPIVGDVWDGQGMFYKFSK